MTRMGRLAAAAAKQIAWAALATLALAASPAPGLAEEGTGRMSLTLTIDDAPQTVGMHQPIPLRLTLRNDGASAAPAPMARRGDPAIYALRAARDPQGPDVITAARSVREMQLFGRTRGAPKVEPLAPGATRSYDADLNAVLAGLLRPGDYLVRATLRVGGVDVTSAPRPLRVAPLEVAAARRAVTSDGTRLASIFARGGAAPAVLMGDSPAGRPELTALRVIATPDVAPLDVALAQEAEQSELWRWAAWRDGAGLHAAMAVADEAAKSVLTLALPEGPARLLTGYQFADGAVVFPVVLGAPGQERLAFARFDAHGGADLSIGEAPDIGLRALAVAVGPGPAGFRAWAMGVASAKGGGERLMVGPLNFPDLVAQGPMVEAVATDGAIEALAPRPIGVGGGTVSALLRTAEGAARVVAVDLATATEARAMPLAATRAPVERIVLAEGEGGDLAALGAIGPNVALSVDGAWRNLRTKVSADARLALVEFANGAMWLLTDDPRAGFGYERVDPAGAGADAGGPDDVDEDVDEAAPDDPDEDEAN